MRHVTNVGDNVLISFRTKSLMTVTFLHYILPVIFLIAGAVLGEKLSVIYGYDSAKLSAGLGFLFLAISFMIVIFIGRRLEKRKDYKPEIIRILRS